MKYSSRLLKIALLCYVFLIKVAPAPGDFEIEVDKVSKGTHLSESANNTKVVNISAPNKAGVLHNLFTKFNVSENGAIINNGMSHNNTTIAGIVQANPNLRNAIPANLIINKVTSQNRSFIKGVTEIAGQRASYILARELHPEELVVLNEAKAGKNPEEQQALDEAAHFAVKSSEGVPSRDAKKQELAALERAGKMRKEELEDLRERSTKAGIEGGFEYSSQDRIVDMVSSQDENIVRVTGIVKSVVGAVSATEVGIASYHMFQTAPSFPVLGPVGGTIFGGLALASAGYGAVGLWEAAGPYESGIGAIVQQSFKEPTELNYVTNIAKNLAIEAGIYAASSMVAKPLGEAFSKVAEKTRSYNSKIQRDMAETAQKLAQMKLSSLEFAGTHSTLKAMESEAKTEGKVALKMQQKVHQEALAKIDADGKKALAQIQEEGERAIRELEEGLTALREVDIHAGKSLDEMMAHKIKMERLKYSADFEGQTSEYASELMKEAKEALRIKRQMVDTRPGDRVIAIGKEPSFELKFGTMEFPKKPLFEPAESASMVRGFGVNRTVVRESEVEVLGLAKTPSPFKAEGGGVDVLERVEPNISNLLRIEKSKITLVEKKVQDTNLMGSYKEVGGHNLHAKKAFEGYTNYDPKEGFSISQKFMDENGWKHKDMTIAQMKLFKKLAESGKLNTMQEQTTIAVEALVAAGAPRQKARNIVAQALLQLRKAKVDKPTNIPWNNKKD